MARTAAHARESRAACELAFAFLVDQFGYRRCIRRFESSGFKLGYCGPGIGVLVEWYPRDALQVWLVLLVNGRFPARSNPADLEKPLRYFDLGDLEALTAQPGNLSQRDLYGATPEAAQLLASNLRMCAGRLLGGDFALIPELEQRVRDRAASHS